jgi:hypothetical protein
MGSGARQELGAKLVFEDDEKARLSTGAGAAGSSSATGDGFISSHRPRGDWFDRDYAV